jgi:ribosomal protein S12 methylthiotransferase accessory factor
MPTPGTLPIAGIPVPKGFVKGTHRLVDPQETVERIKRLMPVLGITRLANITGLDTIGIPTVSAYRPNSRSLAVAQGKGLTLASAEASALMEAVEFYHAERVLLPLKLATFKELRFSHNLVDVHALVSPEESLFHDEARILWVEGRDLLGGEAVWLPFESVHLDCRLPKPAGSGCFEQNSNGLASGNHLLEAISHSLCELVERDSYTRFLAAGREWQASRRLDLSTVDDASCQWVLERYDRAEILVAAWEMTSEIGIPAFLCVIVDRDTGWRSVSASGGMGCHPTRQVALLRALTEAAQSRLTSISGARDDLIRGQEEILRAQDVVGKVRSGLKDEPPVRNFRTIESWESDTFDGDVNWLLKRLQAFGMKRVIFVDLTLPDLGIPVVRMVVPGLFGIVHSS